MSSCREIARRSCAEPKKNFRSLEQMVRSYIRDHRPIEQQEWDFFEKAPSFDIALENAALAKNQKGQRFSHQYRLTRANLKRAHETLKKHRPQIEEAESFDDVFKIVEGIVAEIPGLGELYTYDTALRISAALQIKPEHVYLHAGTKVGAKRLGIDTKRVFIHRSDLPNDLQQLKPHEIESFLCIYKNQLGAVMRLRNL
ncbi:hypothetical protein [Paraburkholderia sp. J12]|uniref:hypothetical protein n=1 Tax=Paraburkholderia sp. J12 TaxID=2805432 RepID=UPI002ABD92AC|nr:hypothetical protein [Paraburkholderia sp. J12]